MSHPLLIAVAGAAALVLTFHALVKAAHRGNGGAHIAAIVQAGTMFAAIWLLVVFGLLLGGYQCDDTCSVAQSAEWWRRRGSWQWTAGVVLVLVSGVAVTYGLVSTQKARFGVAQRLIGLAAVAACAWFVLMQPVLTR